MKKISALLLVFALLFTAIPIGSISATGSEDDNTVRILAIGNSYSNNATQYISSIADSMGKNVSVTSLYYAGCTLKQHVTYYNNEDARYLLYTNGEYENGGSEKVTMQSAFAAADYDYVTVQQSPSGSDVFSTYWTEEAPYLTDLYQIITDNEPQAEVLIHQTWSFCHNCAIGNDPYWETDYSNSLEMFEEIKACYEQAADKLGIDKDTGIIPVGAAIQLAKDEFGYGDYYNQGSNLTDAQHCANDALYTDAVDHLNVRGRYIAACVWLEKIFGLDCTTATYFPEGILTEAECATLRSIAHETVTGAVDTVYNDGMYDWRAVPYGDGLKITHFMGTVPEDGAISIPSALNEQAVTAVDDTVFKYVSGVKSITFEDGADILVEAGAFDGITDIWYGQIADSYAGGQGTEADPYLIENGAQLSLALNSFGKNTDGSAAYYKLTADIYLNNVTSTDWISNSNNNKWFEGKDKNGYYTLDGSRSGVFKGSIDGDGHVVYGIWYPEDTASFASGFIPVFSGSYVKNLGVDRAYIVTNLSTTSSENGAGAIAGITKGSLMSIDSCFSGADVTVKTGAGGAAGIVGAVRNGAEHKLYVSNCYSLIPNDNLIVGGSSAEKAAFATGIISSTWQCYFSVTNSYSIAKPFCLRSANYMSQDCIDSTDPDNKKASSAIIENFANVYSASSVTTGWDGAFSKWGTYTDEAGREYVVAKQLTEAQMTGASALENMDLGDKFFATDSYPVLKMFYPQLEPGTVWDGATLIVPTTGSGTEADPFEIFSAAQLAYALNSFGKTADGAAAHYKLTADIYLNDVSENNWTSNSNNTWFEGKDKNGYYTLDKSASGAFVGSIDGNGHMVYGIFYPETTTSFASGLVPVFSGSYIRNLGVDKAYIVSDLSSTSGEKGAGAIAGITRDSLMSIDSCFSGADITVKSNNSGASGIVGTVRNGAEHKLSISNCYSLIPGSNLIMKNGETDRAADSAYGTFANGIIGNTWVCYFSVTNSYSIAKPYCLRNANYVSQDCLNSDKTSVSSAVIENFANVYSASDVTKGWLSGSTNVFANWGTYTDPNTNEVYTVAKQLSATQMQGTNAFEKMTGFDDSIWYAVKDDTKSPMLRVHGTAIGDVDEDGVGLTTGDAEALRKHLISTAQASNGDYNKDDDTDILDLVAFTLAKK